MLYIPTETVGIDSLIKGIQTDLYNNLNWSGEVNGYGRIYKNIRDGLTIPEWYEGEREYTPVYYNDNFSGNFFFVDEDTHSTQDEFAYQSKVKVVFMVDLSAILPYDTHRADMTAQNEAIRILQELADGRYTIGKLEKGLTNILRGMDTTQIKFSDIQPLHCFAVVLNVTYYLNC